jgi:phage tail sheath gpL-like
MEMTTYHERPGVYSDYDCSSLTATGSAEKVIALVGVSAAASEPLLTVTSYVSGASAVGTETELGGMLRLAYQNGAATVLLAPVASDDKAAYAAAFDRVFAEKSASLIVCASADAEVQADLKTRVETASAQRCECIGLCGLGASATADELIAAAANLNSERMVLVAPGFYVGAEERSGAAGAAALAGVLAAQTDPALPLNGAALLGLAGTTADFDDTALDRLICGGVTVCETASSETSVIRAVTTRTTTGGAADTTWRELTTTMILDEVIPAIRTALRTKFARAKNNALTRSAIRSQVIVELEDRVSREIIDSYDDVTVTASTSDATTALVEFGFTVTHGLNRIFLTAHISV